MSHTEKITITGPLPHDFDLNKYKYCVKIENGMKFPEKLLIFEFDSREEADRFALEYVRNDQD